MISSAYRWVVGFAWVMAICVTTIVCSIFAKSGAYERFFKAMVRGLFRVLVIPVRVRGTGHLAPQRAGRLYLCNHVSLFDVPLLCGFLPGMVRGVEWGPHFRWPLYGLMIRRIGNIPIDRDDAFASMRSLQRARRRLQAGHSLVIMPEAHRTVDGQLRQFKRLPFHIAREAGVEVVPVGISGLYGLHRKGSWVIRSSRLLLRVGTPISAGTVRTSTAAELRDLTRQRILELVERP